MNNKLVSIMIPTYNAAGTIRQTLESILRQSYTNMEIVIVDNASTDNTVEIARQYNDLRLKTIVNETNIGAESNFNKCIELAQGDYIAIYHADDVYETDMVAKEVAFLNTYSEAGAVFTMGNIIDEKNKIIGKLSLPRKLQKDSPIYTLTEILSSLLENGNSFLICPTVMTRRDIYKNQIKKWREELFGSAADMDVWLRILENHPICILNEPLINYRHSTTHWTYNYNKLRTKRDDGLYVYDFYINKYKKLLPANDIANYQFLTKKDDILRAIHHILKYEYNDAKLLLKGLFYRDILKLGMQNTRNMKIYFAGVILVLGLKIGLGYFIAKILKQFY